MRVALPELVEGRRRRPGATAFPGPGVGEAPAVEDDERHRRDRDRVGPVGEGAQPLHQLGRRDDRGEVVGIEGGAADERAVDSLRPSSSAALPGLTEPP